MTTKEKLTKQMKELKGLNLQAFRYNFFETCKNMPLLAEFNINGADHWYIIHFYTGDNPTGYSLQENLENGEIQYILEAVTFTKLKNKIKKLLQDVK